MRTAQKKVARVVGVLEGAKPQLVSLVNHAGNQTPFQHVRAADGGEIVTRERTRGAAPKTVLVRSISFAKENFADVDAVTTYMDTHGFSDFAVAKRDDGSFHIEATADELVDTSTIELAPGVSAVVGRAATPGSETRAAAPAPAPAAPQTVSRADAAAAQHERYDAWSAYYHAEYYDPEAVTIAGVMKHGADGLPPGYEETLWAFNAAVRNCLKARNRSGLTALGSELTAFIQTLADTFDDATVPDPELHNRSEGETTMSTAAPTTTAAAAAATATPAPAAAAARTEAAPAAAAVADTATAAVVDAPAAAATPAPSIEDTLSRIAGSVETLATSVSTRFDELTARLDTLEGKGAPAAADATTTDAAATTRAAAPVVTPERRGAEADGAARAAEPAAPIDPERKRDLECMARMDANRFGLGF